jgi:hypothetical protein
MHASNIVMSMRNRQNLYLLVKADNMGASLCVRTHMHTLTHTCMHILKKISHCHIFASRCPF